MPASPAKIAANRANARKSTGPRTPEGKARSRANAYKHGLTGDGVILATEDTEQVAARFTVLMDEMGPKTLLGGILVKRTAMLSVRLDRSYEQEANTLSARVLSAETVLADRRLSEAENLLEKIHEAPLTHYRRLMTTPEGVKVMIGRWEGLKRDLDHIEGCRWNMHHYSATDHLKGHSGGMVDISPYRAWSLAIHGCYDFLRESHFEGMKTDEDRRRLAMNTVAGFIDDDIAQLTAHLATIDTRAIEAERSFAAGRALFDPSKDAILARRYEAAAERGLYRAIAEFREVEAEGEAEIPLAIDGAVPLASFFPRRARPTDPRAGRPRGRPARRRPRCRPGRSWLRFSRRRRGGSG